MKTKQQILIELKDEISNLYRYLNFAIITNTDEIEEVTNKILRLENEYKQIVIELESGEVK